MIKARKYRNVPTVIDGIKFASKREAARYAELKLLKRAGQISHLELQPKFKFMVEGRPLLIRSKGYPNGRQAGYKADFSYMDKHGERIVEDVKSPASRTQAYALRKALVEACWGVVIKEVD